MKYLDIASKVNRILLGLVMLVPGLLKLFVLGPSAVAGMLAGFGFPMATFFAWLLIVVEIGSGLAVLIGWKLEYTAIAPAVILVIAGLLVYRTDYGNLLMHLVIASNFVAVACMHCKKK